MEQPDENKRSEFFEQLLTVRMPTAGPAASPAAPHDRARLTAPPAATERPSEAPALAIDELPTARMLTHPPAQQPPQQSTEADNEEFAQSLHAVPRITYAPAPNQATPKPAWSRRRARSARQPLSRQRRVVAIAAFSVLLFVVAMLPVLYVISSTQSSRPNTSGIPAGIRPPGGRPQDWASLARQQAELGYVNQLISHMTLDEEIGQMIMLGFLETQMSPSLEYTIKQFHLGSVILYAWNITGADQVKQLTTQIQAQGDMPLLVATDQEGGSVNRLQAVDGPLPSAAAIGARGSTDFARQRGVQDAQQLIDLGINVNLAPVVDVSNTGLGDLSDRTFGTTPDQVTKMAGAYLAGLQSSGQVVGALKHFPGLGDVPADPHKSLYTLDRSKADLERIDWAPYKSMIASGAAQMVMSTHVVLSAIDPTRPASLSKPVLTGILRDQLGFQGVIVTDGIYMGALTSHYTFDQIIVDAVEAGNDIICSTYSIASTADTVHALENAVATGQITRARIDESVRRILLLKLHYGVLTMPMGQS